MKILKFIYILLFLFGIGMIFLNHFIVYNASPSEKIGYYFIYNSKINKGDLRIICLKYHNTYQNTMVSLGLPKRGNCLNNKASILKTVVGMPGDNILITKSGVYVNNILLENSTSLPKYHSINLNPVKIGYNHTLLQNEYWLYGLGHHSFDSRYFGTISEDELKQKAIYSMSLTKIQRVVNEI